MELACIYWLMQIQFDSVHESCVPQGSLIYFPIKYIHRPYAQRYWEKTWELSKISREHHSERKNGVYIWLLYKLSRCIYALSNSTWMYTIFIPKKDKRREL